MNSLSLDSNSPLNDWLHYLESLNPKEIDLGLDRVTHAATQMNLFSKLSSQQHNSSQVLRPRIVTVAGTNGKGSCVATLESLILSAEKSVGAYTSPHFLDYNERIRINGENANDERIVSAFCAVEQARGDVRLTYFEFGTLAAIWLFVESKVDVIVLEVGLGGRLDAVNAFDPDVAIVTSVALDHQDWLGNDREIIGFAKAGIYRANKPAICVDEHPPQSVVSFAEKINAHLLLKDRDIVWGCENELFHWQGVDERGDKLTLDNLPIPNLPLPSVAAALQATTLLGFDLFTLPIKKVLSTLSLTGRAQEIVVDGKRILLDVAHNPAAAVYLRDRLEKEPAKKILAVFAVMADKDYPSIFDALDTRIDRWFVSGIADNARAETAEKLGTVLAELGLHVDTYDTVPESFVAALAAASKQDLIVVLGSFYTVAAVLNNFNCD